MTPELVSQKTGGEIVRRASGPGKVALYPEALSYRAEVSVPQPYAKTGRNGCNIRSGTAATNRVNSAVLVWLIACTALVASSRQHNTSCQCFQVEIVLQQASLAVLSSKEDFTARGIAMSQTLPETCTKF